MWAMNFLVVTRRERNWSERVVTDTLSSLSRTFRIQNFPPLWDRKKMQLKKRSEKVGVSIHRLKKGWRLCLKKDREGWVEGSTQEGRRSQMAREAIGKTPRGGRGANSGGVCMGGNKEYEKETHSQCAVNGVRFSKTRGNPIKIPRFKARSVNRPIGKYFGGNRFLARILEELFEESRNCVHGSAKTFVYFTACSPRRFFGKNFSDVLQKKIFKQLKNYRHNSTRIQD